MSSPFDPQNKPPEGYNVPPPQPGYPYGYPNIPQGQPPYSGQQPPYGAYPNQQPPYLGQPPYSQPAYNESPPPYGAYPGQQPPYPGYPPPPIGYGYPLPNGYPYPTPYGYNTELPPFGYPGIPMNQAAVAKASFLQRVGATLIDGLILSPLACVFIFVMFGMIASQASSTSTTTARINAVQGNTLIFALGIAILAGLYQVLLVATGQTLGDKVLKIRVITADGKRPGITTSLIRYTGPLVLSLLSALVTLLTTPSITTTTSSSYVANTTPTSSISSIFSLISLIAYLWMVWDKDKQTLFDKLAGTYVVKTVV